MFYVKNVFIIMKELYAYSDMYTRDFNYIVRARIKIGFPCNK